MLKIKGFAYFVLGDIWGEHHSDYIFRDQRIRGYCELEHGIKQQYKTDQCTSCRPSKPQTLHAPKRTIININSKVFFINYLVCFGLASRASTSS
jgi:hypothetical protein